MTSSVATNTIGRHTLAIEAISHHPAPRPAAALSLRQDSAPPLQLGKPSFAKPFCWWWNIEPLKKVLMQYTWQMLHKEAPAIGIPKLPTFSYCKINDNLESMAQALYDYWFVQFDFPDENGKPYKSSGGKMVWNEVLKREIPEGWRVISIADILNPQKAPFKLDAKQYMQSGKYPIFDQATDNYIAGYTNDDDAKQNSHPAVIFGDHSCTVKLASSPFARGADGTQVMTTSHPNLPIYYFYRYIKSIKVPNPGYARHFKFLKASLIILPDKTTVDVFNACASAIEQKIWSLHCEKQHLSLQRDFLLPLLMNGQVQVRPQRVNYHFFPLYTA